MARDKRSPEDDYRRQKAFEQMAKELGFELEHASFEVGDHTEVGGVIGAMSAVAEIGDVVSGAEPTSADDVDIETIIETWEKMAPKDYKEDFGDVAHDPYLLITHEKIGHMSEADIDDMDAFEEELENYALDSPRDVTVSNVQVVHVGGKRAVATYTVEENFTDSTSFNGNSFAVLVKTDDGWRIIAANDRFA